VEECREREARLALVICSCAFCLFIRSFVPWDFGVRRYPSECDCGVGISGPQEVKFLMYRIPYVVRWSWFADLQCADGRLIIHIDANIVDAIQSVPVPVLCCLSSDQFYSQ